MDAEALLPQIEKMRMGVSYSFPVSLRDFTVTLRPLSNAEMMEAQGEAALEVSKLPPHRRTNTAQDNELAKSYLEKASSPYGHFAPQLPRLMLSQMTTDEIMYFYKEWLAVVEKVNPVLEKLPTERLQEVVAALKKSPEGERLSLLTELSFGQLANLASFLLTSDGSPADK